MSGGLENRLERLLPKGRGVWIPMDHGLSGYPEEGLDRMDSVIDSIISGGADAIVCQKGVVSQQSIRTGWDGFVCHVSASTSHGGENSQFKVKIASAAEAFSRGATGVSGQINLGDENEPEMIVDMGELTSEAHEMEMPVLGMVYPRGPNLVTLPNDITGGVAHAARVAYEMGCHVVKVPWTGNAESFRKVCDAVPIPVLIAGGPSGGSFDETLEIVRYAMSAGGAGVCMGRQVFGAKDPAACVRALRAIIHEM
ncbi:MAG: 2-amino-3,7-dideoxy-D-threo-hept-6-ulosonate synthase [Candidatus Poseidoniales archaeon]|nr:2-amino-3,7-dideoxy-D-threo-hept-6-ulosonate synthase [Candidatus Poseidoniales archaeon]